MDEDLNSLSLDQLLLRVRHQVNARKLDESYVRPRLIGMLELAAVHRHEITIDGLSWSPSMLESRPTILWRLLDHERPSGHLWMSLNQIERAGFRLIDLITLSHRQELIDRRPTQPLRPGSQISWIGRERARLVEEYLKSIGLRFGVTLSEEEKKMFDLQ